MGALKHVNDHVLQDIEDYILLEGFKKDKPDRVRKIIEDDHASRITNTKKLTQVNDSETYDEKAKVNIKKRRFMNTLRPPYYWNFFEDGPSPDRVDHVLRHNADPIKCYSDGRIEKIMENIEQVGMNLSMYESEKWNRIRKDTLVIFNQEYKNY